MTASRQRFWLEFSELHLRALGVFCAGLLLAEVNVLGSRHYKQFDASRDGRYTLSEATRRFVGDLSEPVEVNVLLGQADPLLGEVRRVLTAYRALSRHVVVRHIDPDRDTAKFLAFAEKYDIKAEGGPDDTLVAEAALLLRRDERTWFIRGGQLSEIDLDGNIQIRIEARLTDGIARVMSSEKPRACFVTGHGERSIDDAAPQGLLELSRKLTKSNVEVERVPLDVPDPNAALSSCPAIFVVGPERPWPEEHVRALGRRVESGASVGLFLDPIVDERGQIAASGLSAALADLGVSETRSFVLETDPTFRLPGGIGETFFAQPKAHPITRGLSTEEARMDARVAIAAGQALAQIPTTTTSVVLHTSALAVTLTNLNDPDQRGQGGEPLSLAIAGQRPTKGDSTQRWLVVGTSNVLENPSFRDPALHGNRVFAEGSVSWLLETRALVTVPERPPLAAGLNLTEESLKKLLHYVLVYMPLTAAISGGVILYRRRRREDDSRREGATL